MIFCPTHGTLVGCNVPYCSFSRSLAHKTNTPIKMGNPPIALDQSLILVWTCYYNGALSPQQTFPPFVDIEVSPKPLNM